MDEELVLHVAMLVLSYGCSVWLCVVTLLLMYVLNKALYDSGLQLM